ncbi:hypothetical protein [Vibrio gazogenes]|uniref:Uncharacterized protein n=1 Tax=Vibrio gazogenes DSM 21264 = NBRC 103151 TaxID=1123492 RepID=A0A1M5A5K7_VIBGA|nr:hypothetical protein [Vibrio gazogenes]USP13345.1 hypothetical protein MKS89_13135 [Vibrio gazogenes]SHF25475.1 hypothetical protein SAMN02745781_01817 [Vibrio gazogenes DSM 21264] [Vibrio gazogenes DSM 21264 = NBRC 103151]SJN56993.1 hypothetical protein BQ6471_02320 [Vibrio gazogenes]
MTNRTDITRNNFFAWSLYTAYRNPMTIGNWVAAEWPGKPIANAQDMQLDIDFRIDMLIEALNIAIAGTANCNGWVRYFVVPEFFFHSAHGPYPGLTINNQSAFEYMTNQLTTRIKETLTHSPDSNRDWVICTGGVLTTHVTDIKHFLAGAEVQHRLTTLNAAYAHAVQRNAVSKPTSHIGLMRLKSFEATTQNNTQFDELNALVNQYRQDPLCTVRNRAGILVYNGNSTGDIIRYSVEKQSESTVDLTLGVLQNGKIDTGGQITEWLANYPPVSIINGDNQGTGTGLYRNPGARMPIVSYHQNVELGAEICLDHRLQRLRRTVNMTGNSPLDIQLVPSGGMQLLDYSIASGSSGAIFNADGCDYILDQYNSDGKPVITNKGKPSSGTTKQVITGVYTASAQTRSEGSDDTPYFSHSQLAYRTTDAGPSDYINPESTDNPGGMTYTGDSSHPANPYLDLYNSPVVYVVTSSNHDVDDYFTAGLGEVHQYSLPI